MPGTFRWGAATRPCRPSGVVHPPQQQMNRRLGRPAGQARTGSLASGIRCRCEQAPGHAQAVQPRCVQPALRYFRPVFRPAIAAEAHQSARIPDVSPVPSSLAPRPLTPETRSHEEGGPEPAAGAAGCAAIRTWRGRRRRQYRSANPSAWLRAERSGPLCRWPATAGSPAPLRGPSGWPRP